MVVVQLKGIILTCIGKVLWYELLLMAAAWSKFMISKQDQEKFNVLVILNFD